MKTFILEIILLFLVSGPLGAAEQVQDIYQKDVEPELVNNVNLAKEKQGKQANAADLKTAESLLSDVLKKKPDYYRALYNLGYVYLSEGDHDKAIETFQKAKGVHDREGIPDNSILNSLGWAYLKAGNFDKAEDYLTAAYKTSADEAVLYNLGFLYSQKGYTAEAREYLTEALTKAKDEDERATAVNLLKVVNDYERQHQMWAVYGEQIRASGNWKERHFDVQGGSKTSVPKPNDTVTAVNNVNIRDAAPVWDDATQDFKVGQPIAYIKPGDRVRVLQILDPNSPTNENAYYFIRLSRLSKK